MDKLNKDFKMKGSEIEFLDNLPDNLPESKLTTKQKDQVSILYRTYITNTIDNKDWTISLADEEKKEKWPSGSRMKTHEAERIVLNNLVTVNGWGDLTDKKASEIFLSFLGYGRKSMQKLIFNAYKK